MTSPLRRTTVLHSKLLAQGGITEGVDGEPVLVAGTTQVEALAASRQMPGSREIALTDCEYHVAGKEAHCMRFNHAMLAIREENAAKNARKRERRARK